MHRSNAVFFIAAGAANAALQLIPNAVSPAMGGLFPRQLGECTIRSTCAQCFGEGYVICDTIGCFNPDKFQQCCSGARLCVGKTNNCCSDWGGPGVTGKAGVPNVTAAPSPTASRTDIVEFSCTRGDTGEQCCQRAPNPPLHWCSGKFPNFSCYNSKNQFCCTDGTVCDEENCCELFNASTTHPWASTATNAPTAPPATTAAATTTSPTTGPVTQPVTSSAGTGSTSGSTPQSTTTSTSGANPSSARNLMALGIVACGLGFALAV